MVEAQVAYGVVGHVAREDSARRLAERLGAYLSVDDGSLGSLTNHDKVWRETAGGDWTCVLEDDAVLIPGFERHIQDAISHLPQPGVISLYTGTHKPYDRQVSDAVKAATGRGDSWLVDRAVLWGPAVLMPTPMVPEMLKAVRRSGIPYDQRLGVFLRRAGLYCYYTVPSLVDHTDGPSLIKGAPGPRRARVFREPTDWNSNATPIRELPV